MSEPKWISKQIALAAHALQIRQNGGSHGVRDDKLLESALDNPKNKYYYSEATLPALAANYTYSIIKNHPFVDGNKRTGFLCGAMFLARNDYRFHASEVDVVVQMNRVAAGFCDEDELAHWFASTS